MTLILGGTFAAGLVTTHLLLLAGVSSLPLRYGFAVCTAYLGFLMLIRLWLIYVGIRAEPVELDADGLHVLAEGGGGAADGLAEGGGSFGGAGASGSWGTPMKAASSGGRTGGGGGGGKSSFSFGFDPDELIVVVLFIALAGALLATGIWLIYTAPAILTEAAFEAILTTALVRRAKKIDRVGWVGAVTRATVLPFAIILALAVGLGFAVEKSCPSATRLQDAFHCAGDLISSPPP
ncbi:MAG TPA: hypothetical protein VGF28_26785 [Thermoanaerobaculia bacterium]|jgi:hypothetical protein